MIQLHFITEVTNKKADTQINLLTVRTYLFLCPNKSADQLECRFFYCAWIFVNTSGSNFPAFNIAISNP